MVALRETDPHSRPGRVEAMLSVAGMPGEAEDRRAVAWMLSLALDAMDPEGGDPELEAALTVAHLRSLRLEEGAEMLRRERGAPDGWCAALGELTRVSGGSPMLWALIRGGVVGFGGEGWGGVARWDIHMDCLARVIDPLYEMGEQTAMRNLARVLTSVVRGRDGDVEIRLRGEAAFRGKGRLRLLREALVREGVREGWRRLPHVRM